MGKSKKVDAAPVAETKPSKVIKKQKDDQEANNDPSKKKRRHGGSSLRSSVRRIFKYGNVDLSSSPNTIRAITGITESTIDKIASVSRRLCENKKKKTISDKEIESAARLVLPLGLLDPALNAGSTAVQKYRQFKVSKKQE